MSWNRQKSNLEAMMVAVLKHKKAMSLQRIVDEIAKVNPEVFTGQTPKNSLYSVIYKRDKKRIEKGFPVLFLKKKSGNEVMYFLNSNFKEIK